MEYTERRVVVKLLVDDIRPAPDDTWVVVRTYRDAVLILAHSKVEELSLDHDLGEERTGYDIAKLLCAEGIWPSRIYLHSQNPVGQANMLQLLDRYAPSTTAVTANHWWWPGWSYEELMEDYLKEVEDEGIQG